MTSSKHWSYRREVKQERRQRRDAERAEAERGYAIDARGKSERSRRKASPAGAAFSLLLTGRDCLLWRFRRALEQLYSHAVTGP